MAEDVFISYCHENKEAARILAEVIAAKNFDVWWDHELVAGDSYTEVIEQKLDAAKAIIVVWSEHSRKSFWVRDEAAVGRDRNRLLPVAIDGNPPPLGFRQIQTIDLQGWDGRDSARLAPLFRGLEGLVRMVDQKARPDAAAASSTNPFGAAPTAPAIEPAKGGQVLAGVNAAPNNKPLKQILREEKKQRTFFRTYFWTSFLLSGILAVMLGVVLSGHDVSVLDLDPGMPATEKFAIAVFSAFMFSGFGLFIGRAFIIIGRRLSKRKSIRYFDSVTLIVMALSVIASAALAATPSHDASLAPANNIALACVAAVMFIFPFFAFFSIPIGFLKGLRRPSYADGK